MNDLQTLEVPVGGMDCTECTLHVQKAIASLPGVDSVDVFLASEKAVIRLDSSRVDLPSIRKAVEGAGYTVGGTGVAAENETQPALGNFTRTILTLFALVFAVILFVVVVGEWLGLFAAITDLVPWPVGLLIVLLAGYPVFKNVLRAAFKGQVISHTLMTLGVIAALAVGEWATAVVVVFFMRVGDYAEKFTTERARRAVKDLTALAPQTALVERDGEEIELPVDQLQPGEVVIVRPGGKIPVDGEVISGQATVNQATITGESLSVEAGPGSQVFAATFAQFGSLRVRANRIGPDTTFGRVVRMVEEAEAHRADVQRIADKFSAYYLPVVAAIAALTLWLRRDPLAAAAVLVVACSCSFALATPIAMLASIGAAAKRGLMIKGGKYLELLAQADVLLIDKTGTLTLGKPQITDILVLQKAGPLSIPLEGAAGPGLPLTYSDPEIELLALAASVERFSEHPLAEAVRVAALERGVRLQEIQSFTAVPGVGVSAVVNGVKVAVGSQRMVEAGGDSLLNHTSIQALQDQGKTLLFVSVENHLAGILAAADTLRPEVPQALQEVYDLGVREVALLTGDNERAAQAIIAQLGQESIRFHANLLPEDKIRIVKEYQARGRQVIMVGDGVNDAPALAQADVGIAMGAAGNDIAMEAAHIALMRADWLLIPEVLRISRRTLGVVKMNIGFTLLYNTLGISLAALGFLPPVFAAAAQSLPDLGILANSSRLLHQKH